MAAGFDLSDCLDAEGAPRPGAPLGLLLTAQAAREPDRPALTADGVTLTRAQLEAAANRRARRLAALGVGPDDVVVVALPNGRAFYETVLAAWKLGATPAHVSWRLTEPEFAEILALARPKLVAGGPEIATPGAVRLPGDDPIDESLSAEPLPPAVARNWKISTSGGSTGRPKLVIDPHPAVWGDEKSAHRRAPGSTLINPGPLYHSGPFGQIVPALLEGGHVVEMGRFDAERWLELMHRHRPDWVYLVPTMMARIARLPAEVRERYDVSSLRTLIHMAAPCPAEVKRFWIDWLGPDVVWEIYGGTERVGSTIINGTDWLAHPGSVGRPRPGIEAKIVDEDGHELPDGQVGEIFFRRPGGPDSTFRYVGAEARRRGDWASFGDLGWRDAEGFLYIADRRTDLIISGGANLYPAEIEAALEGCPGVLAAVVVGLPDADLGQRPHAVVQVAELGAADEASILAELRGRLAVTKLPRTLELTTRPLRDEAGKVRRSALRDDILSR